MVSPTAVRSSVYCCCRARNSGSLISTGETTWASDGITNGGRMIKAAMIKAATVRPVMDKGPVSAELLLGIHHSGSMIGRIGDEADVRNQRLNLGLAESISVGGHQRGLVERGSAVANDGGQVIVAHLVESVTLVEWVWLDFKIVVI